MAFTNGDIAAVTLSTGPIRKNKTPYSGCFVLDGTTTANDWEEGKYIPSKDLPKLKNPSKGYIVSANNRLAPDNVKYDMGQAITSTARAQRLTELLENSIKAGEKFTIEDIKRIHID
jgi:penicillin G amidase